MPEDNGPIKAFNWEYRWLSNFHPCTVRLDNVPYPSVEHAYQAAKTLNMEQRRIIQNAKSASKAKHLGGRNGIVTLRPGWDAIKLEVMLSLLFNKFADEELCRLLLATGNRELVEGNWWGDTYWGVCNGAGSNHLGRLLTEVRDQYRLLLP